METKRCGLSDEGRHLTRGWLPRLAPWAAMVGLLLWGGCKRNQAGPPADAVGGGLNPAHFLGAGLVPGIPITTVPCTLTGDAGATCYSISIPGKPADHPPGRYCPRSITDGADAGGLWIREGDGKVYAVSGDFIAHLADFYDGGSGDGGWQMFDPETGRVRVTDTKEACLAAAKIGVPAAYYNHCVECSLEDVVDGGTVLTFQVPTIPVPLEENSDAGSIDHVSPVGVALNGVAFDSPAPLDRIIESYTIAPFDHCGGHVSPASGYHYHGATGCSAQVAQRDGHAPLIGYARDGYAMHAMRNEDGTEPEDLDPCRGHTDAARGYHYHVADIGENALIGCFHGRQGRVVRQ